MKIIKSITLSKDFGHNPGARYKKDGPYSGEEFLEKLLLPSFEEAVNGGGALEIDLNNLSGFPSSFVSGSFGKLSLLKTPDLVLKHIVFNSEDNPLRADKAINQIKHPQAKPWATNWNE